MHEFLELLHEMSPYLLLGFLIAGLLHAFVPGRLYSQYLSGSNLRSVLLATLFGIPLPLCSCGVIPTAMSLRREGASKGAATAFLIATPQTGIDSIAATFALLGLPFALLRPLVALITAIAGGWLVNRFDPTTEASALDIQNSACADACCNTTIATAPRNFWSKLGEALHYGLVHMMADLGKWLILGLVVAGLITVFVPTDFFNTYAHNTWLSMLLVLLFSIPMYLCATGSIPIAAALMLKGLSPGAALVLLMAGPASSMASILVVRKVLGTRTLLLYLGSIVGGAVLFGSLIDHALPRAWFVPSFAQTASCVGCEPHTSWFSWGCTITMLALLLYALLLRPLLQRFAQGKKGKSSHQHYHIEGLSCQHCCQKAEEALRKVQGVETVQIDLDQATAHIEGSVSETQLREALSPLGLQLKGH